MNDNGRGARANVAAGERDDMTTATACFFRGKVDATSPGCPIMPHFLPAAHVEPGGQSTSLAQAGHFRIDQLDVTHGTDFIFW